MKNIICIISILFLSGCGSSKSNDLNLGLPFSSSNYPVHPETDPLIIPIVQRFAYESDRMGNKISVSSMPIILKESCKAGESPPACMPSSRQGTCVYHSHVEINKTHMWPTYSAEMVIFHELGHCLFSRDHDDTMVPIYNFGKEELNYGRFDQVPATLLNTQGVSSSEYKKNYISYLKELFLNQKPTKLKDPYDYKLENERDENFYKQNFPNWSIK